MQVRILLSPLCIAKQSLAGGFLSPGIFNFKINHVEAIIRARLAHDVEFLKLCILRVHSQQDSDEQLHKSTHRENRRGFNKSDAHFLSEVAGLYRSGSSILLATRQAAARRMSKYAGQLTHLLTEKEIEE